MSALACRHDFLHPGESTGDDEQDVRRVDLNEVLLGVLAPSLRRNRGDSSFEDLQQGLLDALTGNIAGDRGVFRLTRNLVDLVDVDDALLRPLNIEVSSLDELKKNVFDVLANIAGFRQSRGVGNCKWDVEHARKSLRQVGFAGAGGPHHQDVRLGDLHAVVFALAFLQGVDALVVVVHGNSQ